MEEEEGNSSLTKYNDEGGVSKVGNTQYSPAVHVHGSPRFMLLRPLLLSVRAYPPSDLERECTQDGRPEEKPGAGTPWILALSFFCLSKNKQRASLAMKAKE